MNVVVCIGGILDADYIYQYNNYGCRAVTELQETVHKKKDENNTLYFISL